MRNRSSGSGGGGDGGGSARGGFNPTRFKPFDECPPDDHREFAVGANESTQVFQLYQVARRTRAILFVAAAETPLPNLTFDINFNFSQTIQPLLDDVGFSCSKRRVHLYEKEVS